MKKLNIKWESSSIGILNVKQQQKNDIARCFGPKRTHTNSSEHSPRTCLSERLFLFVLLTIDHTHTYIHGKHTHPHTSPNLYVACNLFIVLSLIFFLSVLIYFNYLYYFVCAVCIFCFRLSAWKSIICSRVLIVLWSYLCLTSFYIFLFSFCWTAANQELKYSQSKAIKKIL